MTKFGKRILRLEKQLRNHGEASDNWWVAFGDGPARPLAKLTDFELIVVSRLGKWNERAEGVPAFTLGRQDGHPVERIRLTLSSFRNM